MNTDTKAQQYRLLNEGEIIREGDEFFSSGGRRVCRMLVGERIDSPETIVRRPITDHAPELLAALEECVGLLEINGYARHTDRALIARVKGEQPEPPTKTQS